MTPQPAERNRSSRAAGFSLVELLVVMAIIGVLAALLLPAIQASRAAARSASCRNNLKQIATAMHLYADVSGRLPPARLDNSTGGAGTSSFFLILPYLEEQWTAQLFDKSHGYKITAENIRVSNTLLPIYLCPEMSVPREVPDPDSTCSEVGAPGSYAVSTGSAISFAPNHPIFQMPPHNGAIIHPKYGATTIAKISAADGSTETFMVGEMDYGLTNHYWSTCKPPNTVKGGETRRAVAYPGVTWASAAGRLNSTSLANLQYGYFYEEFEAFRSDHASGAHFAFVDGSARFISEDIDQTVYKALATRDGAEQIDSTSY